MFDISDTAAEDIVNETRDVEGKLSELSLHGKTIHQCDMVMLAALEAMHTGESEYNFITKDSKIDKLLSLMASCWFSADGGSKKHLDGLSVAAFHKLQKRAEDYSKAA